MINPFNVEQQDTGVFRETESTIYTNEQSIPLYLANRLVDISEASYGGEPTPNLISATTLAQPIKEIIHKLNRVEAPYKVTIDANSLIKSVNGSILHEAYLQDEPDRQFKTILGYTISGGTDYLRPTGPDGALELRDIKTTSSFNVQKIKAEAELCPIGMPLADMRIKYPTMFKYVSQLSIYNWLYDLNLSVGYLDFIIMNHSPMDMSTTGPQMQGFQIPLASIEETVAYITDKVDKIIKYRASGFMPDCTQQELTGKPKPVFKLIKSTDIGKPSPRAVSGSGNHSSMAAAAAHQSSDPKFASTVVFNATKPNTTPPACMGFCEFGRATDTNGNTICQQGHDIIMQQS